MDGAVTLDSVQKIVATGADENFGAHLPAKAKPVSLRRKSTPDAGMQEENHEWLPYLADGVGKRCIGRDPMSIPVEVLTASGHPPRRTRELVNAFAKGTVATLLWLEDIREYGTFAAMPALRRWQCCRGSPLHHDQLPLLAISDGKQSAQSATRAQSLCKGGRQ